MMTSLLIHVNCLLVHIDAHVWVAAAERCSVLHQNTRLYIIFQTFEHGYQRTGVTHTLSSCLWSGWGGMLSIDAIDCTEAFTSSPSKSICSRGLLCPACPFILAGERSKGLQQQAGLKTHWSSVEMGSSLSALQSLTSDWKWLTWKLLCHPCMYTSQPMSATNPQLPADEWVCEGKPAPSDTAMQACSEFRWRDFIIRGQDVNTCLSEQSNSDWSLLRRPSRSSIL